MRVLDLFSGIGGFSLGLERAGMATVQFCEIEPYCQAVLAKHWPGVVCHDDIRTLSRPGPVDLIAGGFPCQDISSAGRKVGLSGVRSGLWSEYARITGAIRPRYILVENSAELLNRGMGEVLGDLASIGYDAEWHCISAAMLGAPHKRDRVWILAYPNANSEPTRALDDEARGLSEAGANVRADTQRRERPLGWLMEGIRREWESVARNGTWHREDSPVGMGVDDGVPSRMDRLRALGNSIVPQIAEMIGRAILKHNGE